MKKKCKAKSLCIGRESLLKPKEGELLRFIFELREQEMGVSASMVATQAASLCREFREKSKNTQYHSARRFVKSVRFVYRVGTH
jgi:hypothetical protein